MEASADKHTKKSTLNTSTALTVYYGSIYNSENVLIQH